MHPKSYLLFFVVGLSVAKTNSIETGETAPLEDTPLYIKSTEHLVVEAISGKIAGRELKTKEFQRPYNAFQGIPYAKPPLGDLRFRSPLPVDNWNGTLEAFADGPKCIQFTSDGGSENCLYLNVFTPKLPARENVSQDIETNREKLPVMVWFYGGAFVGGSSKAENYSPDYFIEESVIVVTFNYRTGVFGFLSTEDYAATGNWGIKDQILALKWIRDNIARFGGDPDNVTVFGQSAGAACASILIQSPLSRGLFHRAILQSGTSLNLWAHARNPRRTAFTLARLLDIETTDTRELVEQLRKVDYRTLQIASVSTDLKETIFHNPLDGLVFAPSTEVNHPEAVLTNHSHEILKRGDFSRIPVMVGLNSQEAVGSIDALNYLKPYIATYDLFSTRLVPKSLNIERHLSRIIVAQLIRWRYFAFKPIVLSNAQLVQYVSDDQFVRPIHEYVKQSSKFAPTYFYVFGYEGPLGVDGKDRDEKGVGHTEELNYLWHRETNLDNAPESDILTRKRLLRLWTNFAKTGNPTPVRDDLLQNVTWPPTNIKTQVYLNITDNLELDSDLESYSIGFWEEIFLKFGIPPFDSY